MKSMRNKYIFTAILLVAITFICMLLTRVGMKEKETGRDGGKEETLTVVTSFYPMYVATENIVADVEGVQLKNLSEPQTGCLHDYQLTPEDMKLLSSADVFVVNGGGIESFLSDVAEQYPNLVIVNATSDISLLEDNAHAWVDVSRYQTQVRTIAKGLSALDTANAMAYAENADAYCDKLKPLEERVSALRKKISGTQVILFHEAYDYVADALGLDVVYVMDLDEERQVSAGEVADVTNAVTHGQVPVILAEELYGKEMGDTVSSETGVTVCYLDTLVRGDMDKDSYIDAFANNMDILEEVFQ